jgi:ComF family protein
MNPVLSLIRDLAGLFLPELCVLCSGSLQQGDFYVCPACWTRLPVFPDRTASPLKSLRGVLDRLWIGWVFDERMRRLVHLFKYDCRPEFGALLIREWLKVIPHREELYQTQIILPVPVHRARLRWRGFNQSERLAHSLAEKIETEMASDEAIRIINTRSQTHLNRAERWRSVSEAFRITDESLFRGRRVLIVDDLATSGATLHALASLLRRCHAASVSAAVLTSPLIGDSQFEKLS